MNYNNYSFTKKAINDASQAVKWYDEKSLIASGNFINELEYVLLKIVASPLRYRLISKNVRVFNFVTFPYRIFYAIEENEIIILRIRHGRQRLLKRYK